MKAIHVTIRQIGNSQGVVIPKPFLVQLGLNSEAGAEMTIEGGALVLRPPASPVRAGWAQAAKEIAEAGDDALVMGEFGNVGDEELEVVAPPEHPRLISNQFNQARMTT